MMHSRFLSLHAETRHSQILQMIDAEICFLSTSFELVEFTIGELAPLLPLKTQRKSDRFDCIIENTQSVYSAHPDILSELILSGGKDISCMELGEAVLYRNKDEMAVVVKKVGTFCHDGRGRFLILVDSNSLASGDGNKLNIQGMLNLLISEILLLSDKFLAHTGGVGCKGECQLWTGNSGAGKTTQTLNMVARGFDFYGDDQVIIGPGEDGIWYAWPFWRSVKVTPDSLQYLDNLPFMDDAFPEVMEKKVINNIDQALATQKPRQARIVAINLLVSDETGILRELDLTEAFQRVAPCFLHALLPTTLIHTMDRIIDLLSEVTVTAVSWDMIEKRDCL